jgi:hypothetical protein
MQKMRVLILFCLAIILFQNTYVLADCIYIGDEIINNFVDENCDGWIQGTSYNLRSIHPRLFINEDNIHIIKYRAETVQKDVYISLKDYCDEYMSETKSVYMDGWDRRSIRYALIYALGEINGVSYSYSIDDYGNKAKDIILMLVRESGSSGDMYHKNDENSIAIVYDWIYDLLTESEKQEIINYFDDEIGSLDITAKAQGYRFGGGLPEAIIPGLAFYGDGVDDSKAKEYVDFIDEWKLELRALEHMSGGDGGHGDALGYFSAYMDGQSYDVTFGFKAVETSTGMDMLKESSYMLQAPFIYYYGHKPFDHQVVPFGDVSPGGWLFSKHLRLTKDAYIQYRIIADKHYQLGDLNSASFTTWFIEDFFNMENDENPFELVMYTNEIEKKSPSELNMPLVKAFGWDEQENSIAKFDNNKAGIGWVFMRSGWEQTNPTYAVFKADPYFYHGHQHVDTLAFHISKGEELALASAGMYFYWYEGNSIEEGGTIGHPHHWYYYHRTISTNNLLIYNPDEEFIQSDYSGPHNFGNDGGQRFDMPSTVRYGHDCLTPGGYCDTGGLIRYEDAEDYTVSTADATIAYNSVLYTENNNLAKVSKVIRDFVYLKSDDGNEDYFVVFDKIDSTNPDFKKTWLLHTVGKPEFDGTNEILNGNNDGGIYISSDSELLTVPGEDYQLYSKTLLPKNPIIKVLGGGVTTTLTQSIPNNEDSINSISVQSTSNFPDKPVVVIDKEVFYCEGKDETHLLNCLRAEDYSKLNEADSHSNGAIVSQTYRWMVNDVDYPVQYGTPTEHFPGEYDSYGTWRIEVSPSVAKESDVFLHVLFPAENSKSMPQTLLIEEDNAVGGLIDDKVIIFGRSGEIDNVGYEIDSTKQTKHFIMDLEPNTNYDVEINGNSESYGTSDSGVLTFSDSITGQHSISIGGGVPMPKCSDGTVYGRCSNDQPLFCDDGTLIQDCSECGCNYNFICELGEICKDISGCSNADKNPKDGEVSGYEINDFIQRFIKGYESINSLFEAIDVWKNDC